MLTDSSRPCHWYWILCILPDEKMIEKETNIHAEKQKEILRYKDNGKRSIMFRVVINTTINKNNE